VPDEVEYKRAGEALEQLGRLRAHAGKRRHRRKQLIEDGRTHKACLYPWQGYRQGSQVTSSSEIRRKRLLFRSWHRGTRESDLILGRFADSHLAGFDAAQLDRYEGLLDCADADIFDWVSGRAAPSPEHDHDVTRLLLSFSSTSRTT
jgi:antitoxin CptB